MAEVFLEQGCGLDSCGGKRRPCRVGGALEAVNRAGEVGEAASGLVLSAELYGAPPAVGVFMVPD